MGLWALLCMHVWIRAWLLGLLGACTARAHCVCMRARVYCVSVCCCVSVRVACVSVRFCFAHYSSRTAKFTSETQFKLIATLDGSTCCRSLLRCPTKMAMIIHSSSAAVDVWSENVTNPVRFAGKLVRTHSLRCCLGNLQRHFRQ